MLLNRCFAISYDKLSSSGNIADKTNNFILIRVICQYVFCFPALASGTKIFGNSIAKSDKLF
jgi:hypothetical protein